MLFFRTIISFLKDKDYRNLLITTTLILLLGATVYHYLEGWTWVDSIYFSVVTLTTIGYGDFAPKTDAGKIFTIVYILLGIGMILSFINAVYIHYTNEMTKNKKESDFK